MGTRIQDLQVTKVTDGDTISVRLNNRDESLRLACVDTEEKTGSPKLPHTKAGELATQFAKTFFLGGDGQLVKVDLEFDTDDPVNVCLVKHRDNFGRLLCYVHKSAENYNLRLVAEGWSPYFTKYGRSRVYHHDFLIAEQKAQAASQIIWDPATNQGGDTRDYQALLPWWGWRESIVQDFRQIKSPHQVISVRLDYQKILDAIDTGTTLTILCDLQDGIIKAGTRGALIKAGSEFRQFNLWLPDTTTAQGQIIVKLLQKRYAAIKQGVEEVGGRGYAYVSGQIEQFRGTPQIVLANYQQISDLPPE
jgi:micrococcal nuclease